MQTQDVIWDALRKADSAEVGTPPAILMNLNIAHDKVERYTDCYVNESHEERLAELISDGWIVFRIQTEFSMIGHVTMAYLAKMKAT